jgi:hypothetical protein
MNVSVSVVQQHQMPTFPEAQMLHKPIVPVRFERIFGQWLSLATTERALALSHDDRKGTRVPTTNLAVRW